MLKENLLKKNVISIILTLCETKTDIKRLYIFRSLMSNRNKEEK